MGGSLCVDKPEANEKQSDHKKSKKKLSEQMSENATKRLKSEFKLLNKIVKCNEQEYYSESMSAVLEYYSKIKCKA